MQSAPLSRVNSSSARPNTTGTQQTPTCPRSAERSKSAFLKPPADGSDSVKILVRIRPFNHNEQGSHSSLAVRSDQCVSLLPHSDTSQYTFDRILKDNTPQEDVFEAAGRKVVDNTLEGLNSCIFAYGQTGSGKTHTMLGDVASTDTGKLARTAGLTPRIFEHLLHRMRLQEKINADDAGSGMVYECHVSFLEIYNECIMDLLNPESANLNVREDAVSGIYVEGLSHHSINSVGDALAVLEAGSKNRHIGETRMNRESSRSHSVLICTLKSRSTRHGIATVLTSRLNLVDLAGSEQQKASGASGERLKEASNINKSLSILGRVINSLAERQRGVRNVHHIPYRDSKLTFLLQDSLGGNAKTVMIANISPSTHNIGETLSTLRFAQRAKRMGNRATVNEDVTGDVSILRREIARLKQQLAEAGQPGNLPCTPRRALRPATPDIGTPESDAGDADFRCKPELLSPSSAAIDAVVEAVERAQAAEHSCQLHQKKMQAYESLVTSYEKEKLQKQMVDKFRESQLKNLEKAVRSGAVAGVNTLANDLCHKLEAKVLHAEAQRDLAKVEAHTSYARADELQSRLDEMQVRYQHREPQHHSMQKQLSNLEDMLLAVKTASRAAARRASSPVPSRTTVGDDGQMVRTAAARCLEDKLADFEIERVQHQREKEDLATQHSREVRNLRQQVASANLKAKELEVHSDGTHMELLGVRSELAQQMNRNEELWNRLQPNQAEKRNLESRIAELVAEIEDLHDVLSSTSLQLQTQSELRAQRDHEIEQANQALDALASECSQLRAQEQELQAELDEHNERQSWIQSTQKDLEGTNKRNAELETENRDLRWEVCRMEEDRQRLAGGGNARSADEEAESAASVIQVMRTEMEALALKLQQEKANAQDAHRNYREELQLIQDARADAQAKCFSAMHERDHISSESLKLRGQLDAAEADLQTERTSIRELRAALTSSRAAASRQEEALQSVSSLPLSPLDHCNVPGDQASLRSAQSYGTIQFPENNRGDGSQIQALRSQMEEVTAEKDLLRRQLKIANEAVERGDSGSLCSEPGKSRPLADASSGQENSFSAEFQAHRIRIAELQKVIQDLECEKEEVVAKLAGEKQLSSDRVYRMRREVHAVQMAAEEDKERALEYIRKDLERETRTHEATQFALEKALQENEDLANELQQASDSLQKVQAQKAELLEQLKEQSSASALVRNTDSTTKLREQLQAAEQRVLVSREKSEQYLRDYAQLAGPVLQLAAWVCPDVDVSGSMRSSMASDENIDSNSRNGRLLSPSSAAMALQRGAVGSALGHSEQWSKVAGMVQGAGSATPAKILEVGHDQLKSTLSDLLIWLNASNVDA